MDVRSAYLGLPDTQIYYEDAGHGFPLIMIHSAAADLRMWDEQFPVFSREYRAIRYDLRGHGRSDAAGGLFYSHVDDLRQLLGILNIDRAFLLGCALGASTAVDFAIEYPQLTAGLALVNPALSGYTYETIQGQVEFLPVESPAAPPLGVIRCPTMVITADSNNDALLGGLEEICRAIPAAKKAQLTGERQVPNLDRPAQFNRIILTFLEWANTALPAKDQPQQLNPSAQQPANG